VLLIVRPTMSNVRDIVRIRERPSDKIDYTIWDQVSPPDHKSIWRLPVQLQGQQLLRLVALINKRPSSKQHCPKMSVEMIAFGFVTANKKNKNGEYL